VLRILYNGLAVPLARLALPVAARFDAKLARGIEARDGVLDRWTEAARRTAGRRPRIWLHAASAGESLQARPLGEAIREAAPEGALFHSFFSPSAERYAGEWEAPDAADYLPFDRPAAMRGMIELLAPDALILVGAETWPNLVWATSERGIPVAQACCRLASTRRARGPARLWTRDLYGRLRAVGAVAEADARAARRLGAGAVAVTGDTRVDVTLARIADAGPPPWTRPPDAGPVLVAGSTGPEDEVVLWPALERVATAHPSVVALVAPHEPAEATLHRLEREGERRGWRVRRLDEVAPVPTEPGPRLVLVDRIGVLYNLYAAADLAYVGGGFHGAVHNTMEPAACGVPVIVGPRHGDPFEVEALAEAGALRTARSADELAAAWLAWLDDPAALRSAGAAARRVIEDAGGATRRTLDFFRSRGLPI